jgi:PHP family Zn ribbon phosphoesterase
VLPLAEAIAGLLGVVSVSSKKVQGAYDELISDFGPEKRILLDTPLESIANSWGRYAPKVLRWRLSRLLADARGENMEFAEEGRGGIYGKLDFDRYITGLPS